MFLFEVGVVFVKYRGVGMASVRSEGVGAGWLALVSHSIKDFSVFLPPSFLSLS